MADEATTNAPPRANSDLGVRVVSALVMLAVAGAALWAGGAVFALFVLAIAIGVLWEWGALARGIAPTALSRATWVLAGIVYVGFAAGVLALVRVHPGGWMATLTIVGAVIAVDVGAYFAGRAIGGPKIAPSISPSKTWAGLFGGVVGATLALGWLGPRAAVLVLGKDAAIAAPTLATVLPWAIAGGILVAVVAQSGDFFESWMKRRAGVKDSGRLIPGHGGLFDRVDGLLAVLWLVGVLGWIDHRFGWLT